MKNVFFCEELVFMQEVINETFRVFNISSGSKDSEVEKKGSYDLVTSLDKEIEKYLIERINEKFFKDSVLSEEFNSQESLQNRTWTIDPIDGTCNMANHIPQYSIQMSFVKNGVVTCSAIKTCSGDLYVAQKDGGAYCNGLRIYSKPRDLKESIASFGDFPHSSKGKSDLTLNAIARIKDQIMKIRLFGAASLDYCYLASGKTDLVFMFTKNAWDIFPGMLLCEEAGCHIYGMDGKPYSLESEGVIATNNDQLFRLVMGNNITK